LAEVAATPSFNQHALVPHIQGQFARFFPIITLKEVAP
jgi:hypothetical protein